MTKTWVKQILVVGLALMGFIAADAFAQATTATVTVNANVQKACRFITTTATMTIANSGAIIDPATTSDATGTVNLSYRCSNTTAPAFDIDSSGAPLDPKSRVVTLTGAGNLPATITVTGGGPGTGMGSGQDKTATVDGLIAYTPDIENAAVGSYTKDVLITISAP